MGQIHRGGIAYANWPYTTRLAALAGFGLHYSINHRFALRADLEDNISTMRFQQKSLQSDWEFTSGLSATMFRR